MSRKRNQVIVDFIEIYRSEPCLWQVKSSEYHDRTKKYAAYKKLEKKLQLLEPGATKNSVVTKINSLRTAFRKEKKKVEASKKSGASADSIYKPVLWYYDLFDFLQDQDTSRVSGFKQEESENDEDSTDNPLSVEEDVNEDNDGATSFNGDVPAKQIPNTISRPASNRKRKINDDLSAKVRDHFKTPKDQPDRYDLLGKTVAVRLRGLEKRVALIAEKQINDILFEAEMGYQSTSRMYDYRPPSTSSTEIPRSFEQIHNSTTAQFVYSDDTTASS